MHGFNYEKFDTFVMREKIAQQENRLIEFSQFLRQNAYNFWLLQVFHLNERNFGRKSFPPTKKSSQSPNPTTN